jgi:hypothetical protein
MNWKIFDINETYILKTVEKILPNTRTPTYTNKYYLDNFKSVLSEVTSWKVLRKMITYKPKKENKKDFHWKSIENKFNEWSNANIFEISFKEFMEDNKLNLLGNEFDGQLNIIIDVVKISNFLGSENVGMNCEYTKKNVTELSFITMNKIPLAVFPIEINKDKCLEDVKNRYKKNNEKKILKKVKKIDYKKNNRLKEIENMRIQKIKKKLDQKNNKLKNIKNKKTAEHIEILFLEEQLKINKCHDQKQQKCLKYMGIKTTEILEIQTKKNTLIDNNDNLINKKTFKHELTGIQSTLNKISIKFENIEEINLIADLGYKSNSTYYLENKKINLITPQRSNQKIHTSERNKDLLKHRYLIENFFANIKKYNRIYLRKDKKIKNYLSFVYMGILEYVVNMIDK